MQSSVIIENRVYMCINIYWRCIVMYKFETHCHTKEVSCCGKMSAADIVEAYIKKGYSGIAITDHYTTATFLKKENLKTSEIADHFLTGYRAALEASNGRLDIILGMEITFYENNNDYLVYGVTEEFLKKYTNLMDMGIERFCKLAHKNGMVVFAAHPFRNAMTIIRPSTLDGIEVHNGNKRHDSRNEIAYLWAQKFGLAMSSGSDCHQKADVGRGGIITKKRITNSQMLIDALLGDKKELIR